MSSAPSCRSHRQSILIGLPQSRLRVRLQPKTWLLWQQPVRRSIAFLITPSSASRESFASKVWVSSSD